MCLCSSILLEISHLKKKKVKKNLVERHTGTLDWPNFNQYFVMICQNVIFFLWVSATYDLKNEISASFQLNEKLYETNSVGF